MQGSNTVWRQLKFRVPDVVHFGIDTVKQLGDEAKRLGAGKVMVLCDAGVAKAGVAQQIYDVLEGAGLSYQSFEEVEPEPSIETLNRAAEIARAGDFDVFVGLGGGSSMDMAKVVSAMMTNQGSVQNFFGVDQIPQRGKPTIMVTTTSGTGSEVTRMAVFTDKQANLKKVVAAQNILADVAIVDPRLTLSLPQSVTADTGIDALIHGIEAYIAVNASPLTDDLALKSIAQVYNNLGTAFAAPGNLQARYNMSMGSFLAGIVLNNAGAGAVHALAYPLGAEYHLAHGKSMTVVLCETLRLESLACMDKFANMAQAMGVDTKGMTQWEARDAALDAIEQLMKAVRLPTTLSDIKADKSLVPQWSVAAHGERRLLGNTPRDLTLQDVEEIFYASF